MRKKQEQKILQAYVKMLKEPRYGIRSYAEIYVPCYLFGIFLGVIGELGPEKGSYLSDLTLILGGSMIGIGLVFHFSSTLWEALAPHVSTESINDRIQELEY